MLLHLTLVWAPCPSAPPQGRTIELVVDTSLIRSALALRDALFAGYNTGACTVAGQSLEDLSLGVAPLVTGAVVVAGGTVPCPDRPRGGTLPPHLVFVVCSGPDAGQLVGLTRGTYSVGRSGTDIVLDDPEVSRVHALLTVERNRVLLRDVSSGNGTWVDDSLVSEATVSVTSRIRLGGSRCRLSLVDQPPPGEPVPHLSEPLEVARPSSVTANPAMVAAALVPLALGIGLALTTGMWLFLGFSVLSAGVGLAPLVARRRARRGFAAALARAAEEDRDRRRAVCDVGWLALQAVASTCPDQAVRRGMDGIPVFVRIGEGTQHANLVVKPAGGFWAPPLLTDVPVVIELASNGTAFPVPEISISGSGLHLLGLARSLLLQLSHSPGAAICVGTDVELPVDARFLPGIVLADTDTALAELSRADFPVPVLLFGSSALWNPPRGRLAAIFRFGVGPGEELPPGPDGSGMRIDLRCGQADLLAEGYPSSFRPDLVGNRSFGRLARARAIRGFADCPAAVAGIGQEFPIPFGRTSLALLVPTAPEQVIRTWARPGPGLAAPIGPSAAGALIFDLVSDGPHLLIAGTTGSGKSELLRSLVLSIALHHSPSDVNFLLIDFKGGAALRILSDLPHAVGLLTDLSAAAVARALKSLLAEIRRREQLFARYLVGDIREWPDPDRPVLPRLVLVIDEFRMLVEDVPGAMGDLMRVATLGRSLGIHLIMATQRPQGALSPDIRANVTATMALRVGSALESHDLIGSTAAATIPVDAPGRALLKVGSGNPIEFQTASTGAPGNEGATGAGVVALASYLRQPEAASPTPVQGQRTVIPTPIAPELATRLVTVLAAATAMKPGAPLHYPVLPELPAIVPPLPDPSSPPGTVPLGLLDLPEQQSQRQLLWSPVEQSHLALVGYPPGGTTDALVHLVDQLVHRVPDHHLYLLDGDGSLGWAAPAPQVGAYVGPQELKRAARVLKLISEQVITRLSRSPGSDDGTPPNPGLVVVISGWGRWAGALRNSRWAWAEGLLQDIARDGLAAGTTLVAAGGRELTTSQFFTQIPNRLYFPLGAGRETILTWPAHSPTEDLLGRCLAQGPIGTTAGALGQVALGRITGPAVNPATGPQPTTQPFRVLPIPSVIRASGDLFRAPVGGPLRVPIGVGGDELGVVYLEPTRGSVFLVLGSAGSGRTTLLQRIAASVPTGTVCLGPGSQAEPDSFWRDLALAHRAGDEPPDALLLIDDADRLAPETHRHLAVLVAAGYRLILTALNSPAVTRIPLAAQARSARAGMVLSPRQPSDGDFFGVRLDCDDCPTPGRGFQLGHGDPLEVQVALPPG
ncbi:FtsK/SpoIIIE domain-containing protein [Arthrobacter sp. TMT4-20]